MENSLYLPNIQFLNNESFSYFKMSTDVNRLKVVLAEKKKTGKWLAEQLGKDPATISKWCTNVAQPGLETLVKISQLLKVEVGKLINAD